MKIFVRKYFYYIALAVTFLVAFILRCYKLGELPDMLNIDEASLGINAWCLANYGVDRYLNEMPFYAQNFEGGQSPLYTYCLTLLVKTVGRGNVSLFLLRVPGLISSMVVVIFGTKLMNLIFQNRKITLMSALLLTICPYFIVHGRIAMDCNLMMGCCAVAFYLLGKYIKTQRLADLIVCGVSFGVTLYSYALSYFILPLFLVTTGLYLLYTRKITFRRCILWAVIVCLTGLPVIIFVCSLFFDMGTVRFLCFNISTMATERLEDIGNSEFWVKVGRIIRITLTNYIYTFEAEEKFYTMYFTSIPFIMIGFARSCKDVVLSLKKRCFSYSAVFVIFYIFCLITTGFTNANAIFQANFYFISYLYFLVYGIYRVYVWVGTYRKIFISVAAFCYLLWGVAFCRYYYTLYSVGSVYEGLYGTLWVAPFTGILEKAENLEAERIYIDCFEKEEFYLFFNLESPYELKDKRHSEGIGRFYLNINSDTPIDDQSAYIVHKKDEEFVSKLLNSEITYEVEEFSHYYLFYVE